MSGIEAMLAAGRIEELISSSPSAASWWRRIEKDLRQIAYDLRSTGADIDVIEGRGRKPEIFETLMSPILVVVDTLEDNIDELIMEPMQKRLHYSPSSSSSKLPRLLAVLAKYAPLLFHPSRAQRMIVDQIHEIQYHLRFIRKLMRSSELEIGARHQTPPAVSRRAVWLPTMESSFVSRESDRSFLIDRLLDGGEEGDRKMISVVGMGGIGKTTLVWTVFNDNRIRAHFHLRIWASVSAQFEDDDIYRSMLKQLGDDDDDAAHSDGDKKSQDQLARRLHGKLQGKTYLVVLDDVWSTDALKRLVSALPLRGQGAVMGRGSRVVVTSRNIDVAEAVGSHFILRLYPLSMEESWALFCESAFSDMMQKCPPELDDIAKSLVEHCRGLPLAIKLYGNLLLGKDRSAWERFYFDAKSKDADADSGDRLMKVLLLSFYQLPPFLKPCLMYLGLFPKGCSMKCAKIARLWLAEGFITKSADGKDPDEIANDYLLQLAQHSLIEAYKIDSSGRMLRFRVHDFMHDAIASIGRELNFISISDRNDDPGFRSRPRRLAANGLGGLERMTRTIHSYHLRSLILSAGVTDAPLLSSFTRLKVLHLKGMQLASFPLDILKLFHLKYLHLRRTNIGELPEDIWKLQNLQTLDLKRSPIAELPNGIVKLRHLRHLLVYEQVYLGVFCPKGMDTLTSLEKLSNLNIGGVEQLEELSRMTKLKKLGITSVSPENGAALCRSILRLSNLQSLYIYSGDDRQRLNVETLSTASSKSLRSINLRGSLNRLPPNLDSTAAASSLTKVRLNFSKLYTDPFTSSLQHDLYNLVELYLHNDAYLGEELHARGGGFGKLRKLYVQNLSILRRVAIDKGAMANLEYLELIECKKLEMVPTGIEHLTHLKEFYVGMVHDSCIERIKTGVDSDKVKHIPVIREIFRVRERLYRRPL